MFSFILGYLELEVGENDIRSTLRFPWVVADCFESDCLREDESVELGLGLGFGSCFVVVF